MYLEQFRYTLMSNHRITTADRNPNNLTTFAYHVKPVYQFLFQGTKCNSYEAKKDFFQWYVLLAIFLFHFSTIDARGFFA